MRRFLEALGSGVVVYVVMAACAGGGSPHAAKPKAEAGPTGGASAGGASGGSAGELGGFAGDSFDAAVDALTDPIPDATANESGSRLKARRIVGVDGSKNFWGWHDSTLKLDCNWATASDGQWRCLPPISAPVSQNFSDAACTTRVAIVPDVCPPKYAYDTVLFGSTACSVNYGYAMYELGYEINQSMYYSKESTGACTMKTLAAGNALYTATLRPASDFAAGTEVVDS